MSRHGTWTDEERQFMRSCDSFRDYSRIEEYKKDIKRCLVLSSWRYSPEEAERIISSENSFIESSFNNKVPAGDTAIDIGYTCG